MRHAPRWDIPKSAEDPDDLHRIPAHTVYVHSAATVRTDTSPPGPRQPAARHHGAYWVGIRHQRPRKIWSESRSLSIDLPAALRSAHVWAERMHMKYARPYGVVVCPMAILYLIFHRPSGDADQPGADPVWHTGQLFAERRYAIRDRMWRRGRAYVPPTLIPAVEAILTTSEPARFRIALDLLGWGEAEPLLSFAEMVAEIPEMLGSSRSEPDPAEDDRRDP